MLNKKQKYQIFDGTDKEAEKYLCFYYGFKNSKELNDFFIKSCISKNNKTHKNKISNAEIMLYDYILISLYLNHFLDYYNTLSNLEDTIERQRYNKNNDILPLDATKQFVHLADYFYEITGKQIRKNIRTKRTWPEFVDTYKEWLTPRLQIIQELSKMQSVLNKKTALGSALGFVATSLALYKNERDFAQAHKADIKAKTDELYEIGKDDMQNAFANDKNFENHLTLEQYLESNRIEISKEQALELEKQEYFDNILNFLNSKGYATQEEYRAYVLANTKIIQKQDALDALSITQNTDKLNFALEHNFSSYAELIEYVDKNVYYETYTVPIWTGKFYVYTTKKRLTGTSEQQKLYNERNEFEEILNKEIAQINKQQWPQSVITDPDINKIEIKLDAMEAEQVTKIENINNSNGPFYQYTTAENEILASEYDEYCDSIYSNMMQTIIENNPDTHDIWDSFSGIPAVLFTCTIGYLGANVAFKYKKQQEIKKAIQLVDTLKEQVK
ncbi:MAG: hypothetical protein IJ301_04575 [Clostridia bacterium]|nr:hypothetical protein [Clostridia bacterium]